MSYMNNKSKFVKTAQKISLFMLSAMMIFGLYSPTANAGLTITTLNPSAVTYSSATLNGMLTEGTLSIAAWFEYGTDANNLNIQTNPQTYNNLGMSFNAPLGSLYTGTTYYYRAVAQNSQGRAYGNILSFTTQYFNPNYQNGSNPILASGAQPGVTTNGFFNVSSNSVILSGYINGNNLATTAWFEYGTDNKKFSNSTSQDSYGYGVNNFNITILDLKPNTLYYFRAVAQNVQGRVFGNILSFVTSPAPYVYNNTPVNSPANTNTLNTILNPATKVNSTSAQLNALIVNTGNTASNTWFEYGTETNNLVNKTESINTGALPAVRHAHTVTGLKANTTYYFRTIADNGTARSISGNNYFTTSATNTSSDTTNKISGATPEANTITPVDTSTLEPLNLSANAFSTGILPNSIFGWLGLVILVLLVMLATQYLLSKNEVVVAHNNAGHH